MTWSACSYRDCVHPPRYFSQTSRKRILRSATYMHHLMQKDEVELCWKLAGPGHRQQEKKNVSHTHLRPGREKCPVHASRNNHPNENSSFVEDSTTTGRISESESDTASGVATPSYLASSLPTMTYTTIQAPPDGTTSIFGAQDLSVVRPGTNIVQREPEGSIGRKGWELSHSDALFQYAESVVKSWTEGSTGSPQYYHD